MLRKWYAQKYLNAHCSGADRAEGIKEFFKRRKSRKGVLFVMGGISTLFKLCLALCKRSGISLLRKLSDLVLGQYRKLQTALWLVKDNIAIICKEYIQENNNHM